MSEFENSAATTIRTALIATETGCSEEIPGRVHGQAGGGISPIRSTGKGMDDFEALCPHSWSSNDCERKHHQQRQRRGSRSREAVEKGSEMLLGIGLHCGLLSLTIA
jgi:hypothetical protein